MSTQKITLPPVSKQRTENIGEDLPPNILSVGAKAKWQKGYYGKGVVTAIIDTGCDTNHPDLKEGIIGGHNFTEEHNSDASIIEDLNGHGTHVAGTLAGAINKTGIVGVAPGADLLILKALNKEGTGSIQALIKAIDYAIDWRGENQEQVRIISVSLGLKKHNEKLHKAIKRAVNNDIIVVASSGNDGDGSLKTDEFRYPGAYKEVQQVGAIDKDHAPDVAYFSNTNDEVDVYAPGVSIYSTSLDGEFRSLSGTSMATPHVAGAVALLIEEYEYILFRKLSTEEIMAVLREHTTSVRVGKDRVIRSLQLDQEHVLEKKEDK
ncbi:intracellular serine protease (plasmid) [Salimicrobium jeotgali]|uniref:Intracellular serine protease n=2 Tax=Salimicrobium jeotgali TaxID=1230341 RepID=K2H4K8_9BACI|nr:S8 family peptidase [Salimicrobium jeotgali]AKG05823.1 intracellular serine protease [Salimicrobium jeotgali]EKE30815.1 intracellular serine protease [Salimicrobium jeotgali]